MPVEGKFTVKLHHVIFKSAVPVDEAPPSFFDAPEVVQTSLEKICVAWARYLQDFVDQTTKLFGAPALPWEGDERTIVSSLAAAIIRCSPGSLAVEEVPVPRFHKSPRGRCDLWASIPDRTHYGSRFSFYLEAKKSGHSQSAEGLSDFLKGRNGVGKLFRLYKRGHASRIRMSPLSPYTKLPEAREHDHYVICMLTTPLNLKAVKKDSAEIEATLREVFKNRQTIAIKYKMGAQKTRTSLGRWPTVAVVVLPNDLRRSGMIATFMVFGSTRDLLAN